MNIAPKDIYRKGRSGKVFRLIGGCECSIFGRANQTTKDTKEYKGNCRR